MIKQTYLSTKCMKVFQKIARSLWNNDRNWQTICYRKQTICYWKLAIKHAQWNLIIFEKVFFAWWYLCLTWWYDSLLDLHVQYDLYLMYYQNDSCGINHIPSYALIVQSISRISTRKIYAIFLEVVVDVRGIV